MIYIDNLKTLLYPRNVAVIGASQNPDKLGYLILENLVKGGFNGSIYPVNPKTEKIMGLEVKKSVSDIEGNIDVAIIIIPSKFVPPVVKECVEKGVKGLIIITGGFGELGPEGEKLEKEIKQITENNNIRVIGPNCQGVINTCNNFCASWPLFNNKGNIGLIAQSGSVGSAFVQNLGREGIGFSTWINIGNKMDVDESDLIDFMNTDPNTSVIAAYLEGVTNGKKFLRTLEKLNKPLVVLKSGGTKAGKKAAQSHTKALAGNDKIWDGVFIQNGILRAETIEELCDFSKYLAFNKKKKIENILAVTSSGGLGIITCDVADKTGIKLPDLSSETQNKLKRVLQPQAVLNNPLDLTMSTYEEFEAAAKIGLNEEKFDAVLLIFGDPIKNASKAISNLLEETDKPIIVSFSGGGDIEEKEKKLINSYGVPVFSAPERAINTIYACSKQ